MNPRTVTKFVGYVLSVIGLSMALCAGLSLLWDDPLRTVRAFANSAALALVLGLALWAPLQVHSELSRRDGFGIVTFGWIAASLVGALPFVWSGLIPSYVAAVFETMSGFTTTGASVIPVLETVPKGLLFWRALTHFYGGMGVLVLVVAILPLIGTGGMQLFRAEMPGPTKDRLTPRIAGTAKRLWLVYMTFVAACAVLLRLGGMDWFDSVCHAFATIATGGFSTRTASIGAYHSGYIEAVIAVFMFLSGANFALHYRAARGMPGVYWRDSEFKLYLFVVCSASFIIAGALRSAGLAQGVGSALRSSFFAVVSVITTTGFATDDFDRWPAVARGLLILLMFVGGCAGSTGGAIKVVRVLVALRAVAGEVRRWLRPQAVVSIKVDRVAVETGLVANTLAFILLYIAVFTVATMLMCLAFPHDPVSAASSVAATLGNVGPGLNAVGPMMNYADIPPAGHIVLTVCMLLGRLELYTVLVLFVPAFWKR